jgi:ferrous iron transport protein B
MRSIVMKEKSRKPPSNTSKASTAHQIAIVGNISVGKTCLFDTLCARRNHSVNIPGSTLDTTRGVMAIGPGGASRKLRRQCEGCKGRGRLKKTYPCYDTTIGNDLPSSHEKCLALDGTAPATPKTPLVTHLFDTPGSATLAANSEDEMVGRDLILSGQMDGVVVVADAKNMRRSLAFALEVAEFGIPMVIDINMLDESEGLGIEIDDGILAGEMGVPVGRTVATERQGVRRLAELILDAQQPIVRVRFSDPVERALDRFEKILSNPLISTRGLGFLLLSEDKGARTWVTTHLGARALELVDGIIKETRQSFNMPLKQLISDALYTKADQIVDRVVTSTAVSPSLLVRFGHLSQQPISGTLIGLIVLFLTYYWVGAFGATFVVDNLATYVFDGFLVPLVEGLVAPIPSAFVRDAIIDPDFGLLPTGLFLAVGIVLPVLFCFYLLQSVLEDSGYLPRLAVLFDRIFRWLGLNGQSFIPLVLGFSCITMAVITTRMLPTRKERIILTLLLILGIPCAPLLAVMLVILGKMPWTASAVIFGLIGTQILVAGYLASKIIPGTLPDLILEIPKMRIPRLRIVFSKTWRRTWAFMGEAVPIFLVASFVVFLIDRAGGLVVLENGLRPFIKGLLGLPDEFVQVFIKTAIRRESGAVELEHVKGSFDNLQMVVTMLVMTFLIPCINATIVIIKERGLVTSLAILSTVAVWAITAGAGLNWVCRSFGITFT